MKIRQWQWLVLGTLLLICVYILNGEAWLAYIVNALAKMVIGIAALYYGSRTLTHIRTHQIKIESDKRLRENSLIIACGIVIAGALFGG